MIYTSYFGNLKNLTKNVIPISICGKAPEWYKGLQYKKLAPKYKFFMEWKESHDNDYYINCFNEQVLNRLNVFEVLNELYSLLPDEQRQIIEITNCPPWSNPHVNIALICYEKPGDFCHRHIISEWFRNYGINCQEI